MNSAGRELEVKFYLSKRGTLEAKLNYIGQVIAPRVHEVNLRFDTPDFSLTRSGRLLRLRQDTRARITYKGEGSDEGGARLRKELEFTVSDFDTSKALFEALGYQVYTMYEKYRTTYKVGNVEVALDEMPTGDFLEIEGPDSESIRGTANLLGLNWQARILDSYTMLFEHLRERLGFDFRDLSFENFKGMEISPETLGVIIADER
jgi:adenylate cyclase, class 2